jgi:hypothetical protein
MGTPTGIGRDRRPNIIFAVFLITAGIVLFLANLGLFPIHRVWDFWPLVFSAIGLGRLYRSQTPGSLLLGLAFVGIGIVATLFSTGIFRLRLHDDSWPLSLVFIGLGVAGLAKVLDNEPWTWGGNRYPHALFRRYRHSKWAHRQWRNANFAGGEPPYPDQAFADQLRSDMDPVLNDYTMMGHIKRRIESQSFQGGRLTSVMGSIEIDLRRARMPDGQRIAQLETNAMMGRIAVRVPDSWRVVWTGSNVMGSFEDKTIPPNTGTQAPQLIVSGDCTMGSIEIES